MPDHWLSILLAFIPESLAWILAETLRPSEVPRLIQR